MTINKANGAGIGGVIGAAILAGLASWTGHPVDPYLSGVILGVIAWVTTYFSPPNKTA